MEISLSPELEEIIKHKVASGMYTSAEEFVREAILSSAERDQAKLLKLNEEIAIGIKQADNGEFSGRTVQGIIKEKESEKSN